MYWFRTPPGVRVGRAALDEDAIRLIEQHNPDVEFDWTRILKGQPEPESEPPPQLQSQGRGESTRRDRGPRRPEAAPSRQPSRPEPPQAQLAQASAAEAIPHLEPEELVEPGGEIAPSAALARLGAEGLSRLRARYAEVLARISERVTDPARQDELKTMAERLNPDTWVTDDEVRLGLDGYETTFEALRAVVGRPRKRRRRRRGGVRLQPENLPAKAAEDLPAQGESHTKAELPPEGGSH